MNKIYVDIDQDFLIFYKSKTWGLIRKNLPEIEKKFGQFQLWIRRSSSGHVHMRIDLSEGVGVLDHFVIRSLMHDDIFRIGIDLRRLFYQGAGEINRIFEMKFKNGIRHEVGKWESVDWRE
jgi:hypothetical protein